MKQVEICKEQEEQSGMKNILYQVYGNSINLAGSPTVHTGIFGEQNKKLLGKRIFNCGWNLLMNTKTEVEELQLGQIQGLYFNYMGLLI